MIRFELSTFCAQICISEPPGLMPGTVVELDMNITREFWSLARIEIQWRVSICVSTQDKLKESKTQTQILLDLLDDTLNVFEDAKSPINDFWTRCSNEIIDAQITEFNLEIVRKSIFDSLAN